MEHLESMNRLIEAQLRELERQFKAVEREKSEGARAEKLAAAGREVESLDSQLALLDMQLLTATDRQRELFAEKLAAHAARRSALDAELAALRKKHGHVVLVDRAEARAEEGGNERQALIEGVDRRVKEADADLDDIISDLNKGKNIMNEVAVELRRQQEKLGLALEQIKDTYSLAKQSKALLKYFQRAMMTDKILIVMIILVIIAVIVIIVLKAMGFKGDTNSTTAIPN